MRKLLICAALLLAAPLASLRLAQLPRPMPLPPKRTHAHIHTHTHTTRMHKRAARLHAQVGEDLVECVERAAVGGAAVGEVDVSVGAGLWGVGG